MKYTLKHLPWDFMSHCVQVLNTSLRCVILVAPGRGDLNGVHLRKDMPKHRDLMFAA
jgi:hypothetical protein